MSFRSLNDGGWDTLFDADGKMLFEYQFKKDVFEQVRHQWWTAFPSSHQTETDVERLCTIVFQGVPPELRPDVWKYLVELYPCTSPLLHRLEYIEAAASRYDNLLDAACAAEAAGNETFRQNKKIIDKDVARTDREHPFFAGDENPNLTALQNVLLAHTMLDPELGYVQGMNDIAGTLLYGSASWLCVCDRLTPFSRPSLLQ